MRILRLTPIVLAFVAGCASPPATPPGPSAKLNPQQAIDKIQNDPNVPDGLKRIQSDTIRKESGMAVHPPGG